MWITSGRRVRGIVPSPSLSHVEHPGDPGSQRSARRSPRPGVCAASHAVARQASRGTRSLCRRCSPHGAGAVRVLPRTRPPQRSEQQSRTPAAERSNQRSNERSSSGRFEVIRPLRRARPSTRVRRLSASDTGRVGAAVDAVPMPARRVHEGRAEPAPRCAVDTAPPQGCDMGVPKYVGAAQFLVVHSP